MAQTTIPVLWREAGVTQLGVDKGDCVILKNLTATEQDYLKKAPRISDRVRLRKQLIRKGVDAARLKQLDAILDEFASTHQSNSENQPAEAASTNGKHKPEADRPGPQIVFRGLGSVSLQAAKLLQEAGYQVKGQPETSSPRQPEWGIRHEESLGKEFLRINPDDDQTIYIVESHRKMSIPLSRHLVETNLTHLPVIISDRFIRVGPWLGGLERPCWQCLELLEHENDPCWPILSSQLEAVGVSEPTLLEAAPAAVFVAHQVHAYLQSEHQPEWRSQCDQLRWDFCRDAFEVEPVPRPIHPDCTQH